ncbi:MAG TPA: START-like domain-containing protein [Bacteroidales bacterium]|nr:START-like domain-containing protein [Bacteroidales bacterium]
MSLKLELEYTLNCSSKVLFSWLSTPEGLEEWFADKVVVEKDLFTFTWDETESEARLSAFKENKFVRFEWIGKEDEESNYFEFKIIVQELTSDLALIITDFTDPEEKEDTIFLWDTQIGDLKRILGI